MNELRTVYVHGVLGEKYGGEFHFAVNNPREAVAALCANFESFRRDYFQFPFYGVVCDGDNRHEGNCADVANAPFSRDIHLVPMIEGRFGALIIAGLGLINITGLTATVLAGVIQIGLLFGISMLLAPKPPDTDTKKDESYMFSGPENTTQQGSAVPLIYGRCFVGSVVISAGIQVERIVGEGEDDETDEGYKLYSWDSVSINPLPAAAPMVRTALALNAPVYENEPRWRAPNG